MEQRSQTREVCCHSGSWVSGPCLQLPGNEDKEASAVPRDIAGIPLSCIEILGSTILQRTMQRFADAESIRSRFWRMPAC